MGKWIRCPVKPCEKPVKNLKTCEKPVFHSLSLAQTHHATGIMDRVGVFHRKRCFSQGECFSQRGVFFTERGVFHR
jgi:hypothetical protein